MKESKFIGTLMPSHPDFQPIIQAMREKYRLPEVNPDGEPITEIYLGDEIIPLEDFRQEIRSLVEKNPNLLPAEYATYYRIGRPGLGKPLLMQEYQLPDEVMAFVNAMYAFLQAHMSMIIPIIDAHYESITNMLYIFLLLGETEELPADWLSKVTVITASGNDLVMALASQAADPEATVQQFRQLYKKTYGKHQPKLTKRLVSTAYYLQLRGIGKPWNFIVEEFIQREKISLPRDKTSKRYIEVRRKAEQLLKKRMQRAEGVLDVLLGDKN